MGQPSGGSNPLFRTTSKIPSRRDFLKFAGTSFIERHGSGTAFCSTGARLLRFIKTMTVNLQAVTDFEKGDLGRVTGHRVTKVEEPTVAEGLVVALQDVRAGSNGWFERR